MDADFGRQAFCFLSAFISVHLRPTLCLGQCATLKKSFRNYEPSAGVQQTMKYWAYLIAKLVVAAGLVFGFGWLINRLLPPHKSYVDGGAFTDPHDLAINIALMLLALFAIGITWLIIWD